MSLPCSKIFCDSLLPIGKEAQTFSLPFSVLYHMSYLSGLHYCSVAEGSLLELTFGTAFPSLSSLEGYQGGGGRVGGGRGGHRRGVALPSPPPCLAEATSILTAVLHPGQPGLELSQAENVEGCSQGRCVTDEGC